MTQELFRITINYDVRECTENILYGLPRFIKAKIVNASKNAAITGWLAAGQPKVNPEDLPVVLQMEVYRGRVMDMHNIQGGAKWLTDALFAKQVTRIKIGGKYKVVDTQPGRVTPDDDARYLRVDGNIKQITGKQYAKNPQIVFIVSKQDEK